MKNVFLFIFIILVIIFSSFNVNKVSAAAISSATSGNWNETSTWTGGVVPGDGDTVTISTGHTVTVTSDVIVGNSGNATYGSVRSVTQNTSGSGYSGASSCSASFSGGSPATAGTLSCSVSGDGVVVGLSGGGKFYQSAPTISVSCTGCAGTPTQPTFTIDGNYGGTAAITVNGTGKIEVNSGATLKVRGDVIVASTLTPRNVLTLNGGSSFLFDSSQAASTTATNYYMGPNGGWAYGNAIACTNTSSNSRVTVGSVQGYSNGSITDRGYQSYGFGINCSYIDIHDLGTATEPGWWTSFNASSPTDNQVNLTNFTITRSGAIPYSIYTLPVNSTVLIQNGVYSDSLDSGCMYFLGGTNSVGTGTRTIDNVVCDKYLSESDSNGSSTIFGNWTITNNYMHKTTSHGTPIGYKTVSNSGNFIRLDSSATGWGTQGDLTDNLFFADHDASSVHYHNTIANDTNGFTWQGNIFDGTISTNATTNDQADGIVIENPASTKTFIFKNNIATRGKTGDGNTALITTRNTSINAQIEVLNNTGFNNAVSGIQIAGSSATAGSIFTKVKSNIFYSPTPSTLGVAINDFNSPLVSDRVDPANIGYNNVYNQISPNVSTYTNATKGYQTKFSSTPLSATTDIDTDPGFVDSWRNVALFDTKYLGNTAPTSWNSVSDGASFSVGDIVSYSNEDYYDGLTVNFRAIKAHTKGSPAYAEPLAGGDAVGEHTNTWREYWELASLYRVRNTMAAGTRYTDSSIGASNDTPIMTLIKWIRKGYSPTNVLLNAAGYDGEDIGAVEVTDNVSPTVSITTPTDGATVNGSVVEITASASDSFGVAGVTFKLDTNTVIGSEDTSSPYSITWDSTAVSDGAHSIIAVARDDAGNIATSTAINITVQNTVVSTPSASAQILGTARGRRNPDNVLAPVFYVASSSQSTTLPFSPKNKFNRNLSYRMEGEDVKDLQKLLNSKGFIISDYGPGSPGNETNYFGILTYRALIKFQEANYQQILVPAGLMRGTGYFGPSTRSFVNSNI